MGEDTNIFSIPQTEIDSFVEDLFERIKERFPDEVYLDVRLNKLGEAMFLIHEFSRRKGLLVYTAITNEIKDSIVPKYEIAVFYDNSQIREDVYYVNKDVKICAFEVIPACLFKSVKRYVEANGLHVYKTVPNPYDENTVHFYIYKHNTTQLFINAVEMCTDVVTREYLLGKLLGYSEESEHEHLTRVAKDQISEAEGALDSSLGYFDLVSRCSITDAQNCYVIKADCLTNIGEDEKVDSDDRGNE